MHRKLFSTIQLRTAEVQRLVSHPNNCQFYSTSGYGRKLRTLFVETIDITPSLLLNT